MNHSVWGMHSRRFYRDSEHGLLLGVCAGLADRFGVPAWLVRIVALVLAWYLLIPAVIAYVIAALIMPDKPLRFYGHVDEKSFWRMHSRRG